MSAIPRAAIVEPKQADLDAFRGGMARNVPLKVIPGNGVGSLSPVQRRRADVLKKKSADSKRDKEENVTRYLAKLPLQLSDQHVEVRKA